MTVYLINSNGRKTVAKNEKKVQLILDYYTINYLLQTAYKILLNTKNISLMFLSCYH